MASLTGTKIKNTYDGLLKTTDNEPLDGTLRTITDGLGNNSSLSLSTSAASVGGTLSVSGISTFDNKVGIGSSSFEAFDVLHISGTNAVANDLTFLGPSTSQVRIKFGAPSSLDGEIAYDNDAKSMKFRTNSSERLLLNSSGASVTGALSVSGNATFDANIFIDGNVINKSDLDTSIAFDTNQISLITGGLTRLSASDASVQVTNPLIASSTLTVTGNYNSINGDIALSNGKIAVGGSVSIANSVGASLFSPNANLLVLGDTGAAANQGMTIVSPTGATGNIYFADGTTGDAEYRGSITYNHNVDTLYIGAAATNKLAISGTQSTFSGNVLVVGDLPSYTNSLYVDSTTNNVGIGTNNPQNSSGYAGLHLNGATGGVVKFMDDATVVSQVFGNNNEITIQAEGEKDVVVKTNGSEAMRIDSSGNVTITSSNENALKLKNSSSQPALIRFNDTSTTQDPYIGSYGNDLAFGVYGGGEKMRIDASGNVGIGVTPSAKLHTSSAAAGNAIGALLANSNTSGSSDSVSLNFGLARNDAFLFNIPAIKFVKNQAWTGTASTIDGYLSFSTINDESIAERMRITSGGNIGINTDNPAVKLEIFGSGNTLRLDSAANQSKEILLRNVGSGTAVIKTDGDLRLDAEDAGKTIQFNTAGSEKMRIDSSGNVGIGCVPDAKLHINDSGDGRIRLGGNSGMEIIHNNAGNTIAEIKQLYASSSASAQLKLTSGFTTFQVGTSGTEAMRIDSSGNVGIGTDVVTAPLTVAGTSDLAWSASTSKLQISRSGSVARLQNYESGSASSLALQWDGGDVGIGTSPSAKLHIQGTNSGILVDTSVAYTPKIKASGALSDLEISSVGNGGNLILKADCTSVSSIQFNNGGSERMRITSGGDVCIGVQSITDATDRSYGNAFSGSGSYANWIAWGSGSHTHAQFRNGTNVVGSISSSSTATAYNTSSDYRLKEDWQPMEDALDRVDALKPVNFAWKVDGKRVDGFLAHELAEVIPEAVTGEKDATEIRSVEVSPAVYEDVIHPAEEAILDEEGNVIQEAKEEWVEKVLVSEAVFEDQEVPVYQGIDQSKIVPLLVAAIQELRAEIESLKSQING